MNSDPKISATLYLSRAVQCSKKGDLNRALEDSNKAIELSPKDFTYYVARANLYKSHLKDYDKALADYATAIKLNPKDVENYKSRGELYESQEKYSEAINDYKTILKLALEKSVAYYDKALEFCPNDEYIEENRQRVLEKLYPDRYTVETFLEQVASFRESKDYAHAIKDYTKVLKRDPENQVAYFYRGFAYFNVGKY